MAVLNIFIIYFVGYIIPSLAIIIKIWMAVNNMKKNISKEIVSLRDYRDQSIMRINSNDLDEYD